MALREVRLALLEADVHFGVAKSLFAHVCDRAVGAAVSRALKPSQQVNKIIHEELGAILGNVVPLALSDPRPRVLILVGLQGSGKTTAAGNLARLLHSGPADGAVRRSSSGSPWRQCAGIGSRLLQSGTGSL